MTSPAPAVPPRHPRLFWSAVVVAALLLGGGVLIAALGYADTSGPDGAVRGYYAALARSDAPSALAFGVVPDGPHTLLTSTVLREQQRIAPLRDFSITATHRSGKRATVAVGYTLAFAGDYRHVTDTVPVREIGGTWRLARAAAKTQLQLTRAADRATIVGAAIPAGSVLVFPGALPIRFDSPYLRLDPADAAVDFSAATTTQATPELSDAGTKAVTAAVAAALRTCLGGADDRDHRCPQPGERFVPGSIHGKVVGGLDGLSIDVGSDDSGRLTINGEARVDAGYQRLTFRGRVVPGHQEFSLPLQASAYAVDPLTITWGLP